MADIRAPAESATGCRGTPDVIVSVFPKVAISFDISDALRAKSHFPEQSRVLVEAEANLDSSVLELRLQFVMQAIANDVIVACAKSLAECEEYGNQQNGCRQVGSVKRWWHVQVSWWVSDSRD